MNYDWITYCPNCGNKPDVQKPPCRTCGHDMIHVFKNDKSFDKQDYSRIWRCFKCIKMFSNLMSLHNHLTFDDRCGDKPNINMKSSLRNNGPTDEEIERNMADYKFVVEI